MVVDFNSLDKKVKSPKKLAHVVLKTNNFQVMNEFYKKFLGGYATWEKEGLSFLTYDDEHHRIALASPPGIQGRNKNSSGLEHIAFTYDTLEDLAVSYRQRKAIGITPFWCVNHGPTTSLYYEDPDGNRLETQVDNFDTGDEAKAYMESESFHTNMVGVDFDPEELVRRLESGEDESLIKKRPEIGARNEPEGYLD